MAEIRVEQKRRSLAWLWILLAVVVAALAYWYFNNDGVNQVDVQTGMAPAARALAASLAASGAAPDALPSLVV